MRRQKGEVRNPIGFTTADLLRILEIKLNAGKIYDVVVEGGKKRPLTGSAGRKARFTLPAGRSSTSLAHRTWFGRHWNGRKRLIRLCSDQ